MDWSRPSGLGSLSDEEILQRRRAFSGPQEVQHLQESEGLLEELFQRYQARVKAWCIQLTGDRNSAADLAQDVFLKALVRLDTFRGEAKFSTWLYAIARNLHIDQIRSGITRGEIAYDEAALQQETQHDAFGQVERQLEQQDAHRHLESAMRGVLSDIEYRVVELHYEQGIPLATISQMLHLRNASGAKAHLLSAQRKLCRKFSGGPYSPGGLRTRSVNHHVWPSKSSTP